MAYESPFDLAVHPPQPQSFIRRRQCAFVALAFVALAFGAILLFAVPLGAETADPRISVIDLAEDLTPRAVNGPAPLTSMRGQASERRLREGNVVGVVLPIHEPRPAVALDMAPEVAFHDLDRWLSQPGEFHRAGCGGGPERIRTWLTLDGGAELVKNPSKIALWVTRGVRIFGLVGATDNELATSFTDPPPGPVVGLTSMGSDVVRWIYAAGGIVDIASGSAMSREDVITIANGMNAPVVAISANARALADDPRNLNDSELRAVGASGGVVAVSFDEHRVVRGRTASLGDVVRQILHIAKIAGIDHVAIGSGYESVRPPDGLETTARFPALARALLATGMSHDGVERVFSHNALRVLCPPSASKR